MMKLLLGLLGYLSSVQLLSRVQLYATPWTAACQASLSITNSWSLPKLMSIELVMPSNHLILCLPFFLLPSIFSSIRIFSTESVLCIRWPKYWSFSFSISPSNEYSGLLSFRIDRFDLLAVQGTPKSLQHNSSKASIPGASVKNPLTDAEDTRDTVLIPESGRSPGVGNGNPLQFAWNIPWTEGPGELQSLGLWRVGHDWTHTHITLAL